MLQMARMSSISEDCAWRWWLHNIVGGWRAETNTHVY